MDIYEELTQEHRQVEGLFTQLEEKGPQKNKQKQSIEKRAA